MIDIIKNYDSQPAFADFLPGIAGENGIPAWCFFVNRGQGVASFGTRDKHRLTRAHREKQLKMSCQALHNAPPNRT